MGDIGAVGWYVFASGSLYPPSRRPSSLCFSYLLLPALYSSSSCAFSLILVLCGLVAPALWSPVPSFQVGSSISDRVDGGYQKRKSPIGNVYIAAGRARGRFLNVI